MKIADDVTFLYPNTGIWIQKRILSNVGHLFSIWNVIQTEKSRDWSELNNHHIKAHN